MKIPKHQPSEETSHNSVSRESVEDEKHSSCSAAHSASNDSLNGTREDTQYPSTLVRWAIVIALLLGEFLVSSKFAREMLKILSY